MKNLGEKLKQIRESKDLGQKEVAELTGINYKTISNYENNRSEPDIENLSKLCKVYDVSADYFIPIETTKSPIIDPFLSNDEITDIRNVYKDFGKRLQQIRTNREMSQTEVADKLGIAQTTYSGYEQGARKIPLEIIIKLSTVLDVGIDYLIMGAKEKAPSTHKALTREQKEKLAEKLYLGVLHAGLIKEGQDLTEEQIKGLEIISYVFTTFFKKGQ